MATSGQVGGYVITTTIWDPSQIYQANLSPELTQLFVTMYQNLNLMSLVLNAKETATYPTQFETVTNGAYFPNPANSSATGIKAALRNVFRTTINFGALPNGTINPVKGVNHNINPTSAFTFTRIYGVASNTTALTYIPLPYVSIAGMNIEVDVTATQVVVTTTAFDWSAYNVVYFVLEYIKF